MERKMTAITPRPGILDIAPYVGGDVEDDGTARIVKLSSNESATGASAKAIEAYKKIAGKLHRYPDGGSADLRAALAERHGIEAANIVCGNGSDELISLITKAYAGPGDEVMATEFSFVMYRLAAKGCGATPVMVPERNLTADIDAMIERLSERTRLVYLANPNNPTGTYVSKDEIVRLRAALPEQALLVVDAAYAEFVMRNDYTSGQELVAEHDNVLMLRTFSKAYGLAALRLGWAYCPDHVVDVLNRVRGPYGVNAAAQAAGVAAVRDVAHLDAARTHNDVWLPWLHDQIAALGLEVVPSVGNFLMVRFPETPGKTADDALAFLAARNVFPRNMRPYGLPEYQRITVGLEDENERLVEALAEFMG
jgi:histidinol-phosphate aminotransferase